MRPIRVAAAVPQRRERFCHATALVANDAIGVMRRWYHRRMRSLVFALLLGATAAAAPPPAGPSPEEVARFRDGLKRGRALVGKGDLDGAVAAFKEALAAMP